LAKIAKLLFLSEISCRGHPCFQLHVAIDTRSRQAENGGKPALCDFSLHVPGEQLNL